MDSMFEDDISILTQDALVQDDEWLDSPNTDLSSEMCSASHFAFITAYDDIKNRLTGLERENTNLKRKLKMYEIKFPLISDFGEERMFPAYDSKETSLLKSEKANLQQQLNQFQRELQKSKEREEQLEEMIQAYEKLCVEKTDLESELGQMRALVDTHLNRIRSLEQQLRQRDGNTFQNLNTQLQNQEVQFRSLHGTHVLDRSVNWQSPRGLEQAEGLEVQRLEVELEKSRQEVQNSQHREEQLKAECERLQAEVKQLQETRAQDLAASQSERDMAWVKKVGDDQVNLALAYTELTEELCRLRNLSSLQNQILRTLMQEQVMNGGQRHSPHSQRHSPAQQRCSPAPQCTSPAQQGRPSAPQCQSPALQRRSPGPSCQSPAHQRRSPAPPPCQSPASQRRSPAPPPSQSPAQQQRCSPVQNCSCPAITSQHRSPGADRNIMDLGYSKPSSHHIKASFQGRRSYSEVSDAALYQQNRSLWLQPEISTLPKHRPYCEVYARDAFEEHLRFEKQSSDEDDWALPSPPSPEAGGIRCASFCAGFPIPDTSMHRIDASYSRAEHAQSWPSINLLMETVDSDIRSCPLCQVAFPIGYPDDALIKHIDSHLENSKI
ncbi:TANK-binding kinase 1-binding protein 1 [Python bivittatus]|uniref:TANK-binding kinase 1-binding protein 1 n=1 Tax=Python bivittatus TaxID=176946 RepID=A0A9F2NBJ2_PYTBI|nr:TANK-binding kinase 1-binding protein 1 [Python bivittatus]XP_025021048.1 TANK-binding kinase 1-binding protein 1 [Python bivittatus]XP_025021049.1 TANK-binding kinase 1-binding protein 1 [Python bivittatus]